jgi:hypothetical protein
MTSSSPRLPRTTIRIARLAAAGVLLAGLGMGGASAAADDPAAVAPASVEVAGERWGTSTCYIGATEGSGGFDIKDLRDSGINTYRLYGGIWRWEYEDDGGGFGTPTVAQIKADPNVVNWRWWDNAMTNPPNGTDYWWVERPNVWYGSARQIFRDLKKSDIRTVLTLRNSDASGKPEWARSLNPPTSEAARTEWWEHVFATVYWLNVRNDYRVDDFQIHNEPDNVGQGWGGTQDEYHEFARLTADAIRYVYRTYLPGRTPHIYGPVTIEGSTWPEAMMKAVPDAFDTVDIHNYNWYTQNYVGTVRGWMDANGFGDAPLWMTEWGTYEPWYGEASTGSDLLGSNLIRMSQPSSYVDGSHVFPFYDWTGDPTIPWDYFQGLVDDKGNRTTSYYGLRIATRALNGCRPTYQSTTSTADLTAITTKGHGRSYSLLVTNASATTTYETTVDLSALRSKGKARHWLYDETHNDVVVGKPKVRAGKVTLTLPPWSTTLLEF